MGRGKVKMFKWFADWLTYEEGWVYLVGIVGILLALATYVLCGYGIAELIRVKENG